MGVDAFCVEAALTSLTVTTDGRAVTRIQFGKHARRPPKGRLEQQIARELKQYLSGQRTEFTFPMKLEGTEFCRRVWREVARIPYGETKTYGEVARAIGNPKAARAVGAANGRNPVPIVVPCHRVVATGGKLGGFGGGLELKRKLLRIENAKRPILR